MNGRRHDKRPIDSLIVTAGFSMVLLLLSCNYFDNEYPTLGVPASAKVTIECPDSLHVDLFEVMVCGSDIDTLHYFTVASAKDHTVSVPVGQLRLIAVNGFSGGMLVAESKRIVSVNGPEDAFVMSLLPVQHTFPDTAKPVDPTVAPAPTGLVAQAFTGSIHLTWNAVPGVETYRVYRSTDGSQGVLLETVVAAVYLDSAVSTGITYYYSVSSVTKAGESAPCPRVAASTLDKTAPAIPTGLSVEAVSHTTLLVKWLAAGDAAGYIVFRALLASGPFTPRDTLPDTVFVDSLLSPSTVYHYAVAARNEAGTSSHSKSTSAQTLPAPTMTPSAPTGLTATALSEASIQLQWTSSSGASRYRIYRETQKMTGRNGSINGSEFIEFTLVDSTDTTVFTDRGLTASTVYRYTVDAVNAKGASPRSDTVSAMTPAPAVVKPAAPTGVTATVLSHSSISVKWLSSISASSYAVYRATSSWGPFSKVATTGLTEWADTGLNQNTTYYYQVSASNSAGESARSTTVSAKTDNFVVPSAPTGVSASMVSNSSISIKWLVAASATSYNVYRAPSSAGPFSIVTTTGLTEWADTGLNQNTTYYYQVSASNAAGESARSATVFAKTGTLLAPPAGLQASPSGASATNVSWFAVSGATGYAVYRRAGGATSIKIGTSSSTAYTDTGLAPSTLFYYKVTSTAAGAESGYSAEVSATTAAPPLPKTPTGFVAEALSGTEIRVRFTAVSGAMNYKLYGTKTSGGTYALIGTVAATSYTHSGLTAATTWYYKVSSVNTAGESPQSAPVSATTKPATVVKYAVVNPSTCTGCGKFWCGVACPLGAVTKVNNKAVIDPAKCDGCGKCVSACPFGAINLVTKP